MSGAQKQIGKRIRQLRKVEHLTQEQFARRLGINRGYISALETCRNQPSEQLILGIYRSFGVNYEWLKEGRGDHMFEIAHKLSQKGERVMEEVLRVIDSPDRIWAISEIAQLLDIDPDDPSKRLNLPPEFRDAVLMILKIFREGDPRKIKAVMSQLLAFMPEITVDYLKEKLKEYSEKMKKYHDEKMGN